MTESTDAFAQVPLGRDHPEIRDAVRAICAKYPGAYWRKLEDSATTRRNSSGNHDAGFLSALIPEEYGGSGLLLAPVASFSRKSTRSGCEATPATRRCT